jgi:pyruvate dehydrogenase E2 component (dihydrolipoamide acetyltransferase)
MATAVIMPKQGQSVESCIIVGWKKKSGDAVKAGDVICEVETDKATFEVESPASGTILALFFEAGSDVPVLTPIAAIGTPGENVDGLRPGRAQPVGASGPSAGAAASPAPGLAASGTSPAGPVTGNGKVAASPRAKALAAARGVPLASLRGTGPGGRIVERDVQAALAQPAAAAGAAAPAPARPSAAPAPAVGEYQDVPLTGTRTLISERMLASLQTTAQLTMHATADAREIQALRAKLKDSPEALRLRDVTINDMVLFAVARSLLEHPDVNAHFIGGVLRRFATVHLGFAVDTPRGLMVPVIRGAQALTLREIAAEKARLARGCREGGVTPEELGGGTFTVTNLGAYGVQGFTPVLNVPQVAILGVGAIMPGPLLGPDGSVGFVPQITLSLTINHQVVDGAPGARFLQTVSGNIARFELLLAG